MKEFEITERGDVSGIRNLNVGGNAHVAGNAHLKGNVKVDGWLEAKNIKSANKGLFVEPEALRTAYPRPHEGWFAGVKSHIIEEGENAGRVAYLVYVGAANGDWVPTDGEYVIVVDDSQTVHLSDELSDLAGSVNALSGTVDDHDLDIRSLKETTISQGGRITTLGEQLESANEAISDLADEAFKKSDVAQSEGQSPTMVMSQKAVTESLAQKADASSLGNKVDTASVGAEGGVAPLDEDGLLPVECLPEGMADELEELVATLGTYDFQDLDEEAAFAEVDSATRLTRLVSGARTIGWLLPMACESGKTYQQACITYLPLTADGHIDFSHGHGGEMHIYKRTFNNTADDITVATSGEVVEPECWSRWEEMAGDGIVAAVDELRSKVAGIESGMADSSPIGNAYNVTAERMAKNDPRPITGGTTYFDEFGTAVLFVWDKGVATIGMQITFATSAAAWKTYQYIGISCADPTAFADPANWLDLAGLSSGSEPIVNINALCDNPNGTYNLSLAIAALLEKEAETDITYRKTGLVIIYRTGEGDWESKIFLGNNPKEIEPTKTTLWKDFGGGGGGTAEVVTSDTPVRRGTNAFSTGGAYDLLPTGIIRLPAEEEGTIKLSLVNAEGDHIGDEVQFAVGTGTGGGGTEVSISLEHSPLYAAAGGSVVIKAAILSVTRSGRTESLNVIESVQLIDRDTRQVLETFRLNRASSDDTETFDFEFDVSAYFAHASTRKFQLVATDDGGRTGSKYITVTAVDVTIKSEQTLHYTKSTALKVGANSPTHFNLYSFPRRVSDIRAVVEIYIDGEWRTLHTATVQNSNSQLVSINPSDCLGHVLTHGAYPLRVHGEDIASGVVGNYLHTAVMVVDSASNTPIVATRWYSEGADASVKLYESVSIDFAVYLPGANSANAQVWYGVAGEEAMVSSQDVSASSTHTFTARVSGVPYDGSAAINIYVASTSGATGLSQAAPFAVNGTLLELDKASGDEFSIDLTSRSNSESDHTIADKVVTLSVEGANWMTNGFVKDSFGTASEGTASDAGRMSLRIAENVTGCLDYKPFADPSIESNGLAVQFQIRKRNMADEDAVLMSCVSGGVGFYVTGKAVVLTFDNSHTAAHTITSALKDDSVTDVAIVVEPSRVAPFGGIGVAKMYFDGEEVGACSYAANSLRSHEAPITFNGEHGELYLYNIAAWRFYLSSAQVFANYLLNKPEAEAMLAEFAFNDVMASQTAEGTTKDRPKAADLYGGGIPYFVLCKNADTADVAEQYPDYLETLNGDKSTKRTLDVYAYFPDRPWQDFKAIGASVTNQGTTSSRRPIKNIKMRLKGATITLLHSRDEFFGDDLDKYDDCARNAADHKVQIYDRSLPTNLITVKVDYSESGGANNGASAHLFNDLQRELGAAYRTPAQNAYEGKYELNTSINSVPCAFYRTDANSPDANSPSHGYFHAKGNWNEDKGDAKVFGFEDVPGYNLGCLNYGDFEEIVASRDQSLADFASAVDKSGWDTEKVYMLSEFCGPLYKFFRHQGGQWVETTGAMTCVNGEWVVNGDVLNPVENYEMKKYDGFNWLMGVDSVDDLLAPDDDGKPVWLQNFESRYPDDDNLNDLYAQGKKLPYRLYSFLRWCQECNHTLTEEDGDIMLQGASVPGTAENRLKKFQREFHTVANVRSFLCYKAFIDYLAAVDQESKNSMLGFYLDTDGVVRLYMNHLYDGDTILGSDNDCGLTVPYDIDIDSDSGFYQGWNSVPYKQAAACDAIWLNATGTETIATKDVVRAMRRLSMPSGLVPFSPAGLRHYWVTLRLSKWPKVVSTFDGERKYIEHSTAEENYMYALHGLGVQRLEDYIDRRFKIRDGYYGYTGDIIKDAIAMRACAPEATGYVVSIKAAKSAFFGIGVDQQECDKSVFLNAGDTHTFVVDKYNVAAGYDIYLFGASALAELDLSAIAVSVQAFSLPSLPYLTTLKFGALRMGNGADLTTLELKMPFLRELDVRGTAVREITATYCPRLESVLADGSALTKIKLAKTSPISTLSLPSTMTELSLVDLPALTYPGGLTIAAGGLANVDKFHVEDCPGVDAVRLLGDLRVAQSGRTALRNIRVSVGTRESVALLRWLMDGGVTGMDKDDNAYNEQGQCSGLTGRWILKQLIEDSDLASLQAYFPALELHNSQYSMVRYDDTVDYCENITNLDNNTGYQFSNDYVASGHFKRLEEMSHGVRGLYNPATHEMEVEALDDENYNFLADGTSIDLSDQSGMGYDFFKYVPSHWYKGINDFKNQCKYSCRSMSTAEPMSTATRIVRSQLGALLLEANAALVLSENVIGSTPATTLNAANNVYGINVEGMKQVRWPGINSDVLGCVFVGADGKIISKFNMGVSSPQFDFMPGEDYIFCDVPVGAVRFLFTAQIGSDSQEAIAVDSAAVEAIEPDWVYRKEFLVGIYGMGQDGLSRARSISNTKVVVGTNTQITSGAWTYDADGRCTNLSVPSNLNRNRQDCINLCEMRGEGFHAISYEQSKDLANIIMELVGTRNIQAYCGNGQGAGYTTGTQTINGKNINAHGNITLRNGSSGVGNLMFGIQNFVACNYEWMAHVAVNVISFKDWKAKRCPTDDGSYPIDARWHIYDVQTDTERAVQGINATDYCIGRVRHGRYMDIVASKLTSDKSQWNKNYSDCFYYSHGRCRVVGRASNNANAYGGLVFSYAYSVSSFSSAYYGSRLAFSGRIVWRKPS